MAKELKNSDVQSPYEADDGVLPVNQMITEPHVSAEVHDKPKTHQPASLPIRMTKTLRPETRPSAGARKPDTVDKWYFDPVTHELILPDIEEIKARMVAKITPDMFPDDYKLAMKLMGNAVSVRDAIQEAFRKNFIEGIGALAAACLSVADVPMCLRLVATMRKLGRYDFLEWQVQCELEFIARRAPAEEVRKAAGDALAAIQRGKHRLVSELSPAFLPRVTRRACSLIATATTGKAAQNDKPSDRSPPAPKSPRSRRRRKKTSAAAEPVRVPSQEQLMELIEATLGSGSTYCGA